MLRKIFVGLAVGLAALAAYIATRPAHFSISRSRTLAAPPDVVARARERFSQMAGVVALGKTGPRDDREYSGAPAGPGASYGWKGNNDVGEGRMTITDSRPPQSVTIRLEFIRPFAATNTTQFDFAPSGPGTNVTWTMSGENNFLSKAFSVFMNMDSLIGADFEQGLANLETATKPVAMPVAIPAQTTSHWLPRYG